MNPKPKVALLSLFLLLFVSVTSEASRLVPGDSIGVERVGEKTYILHKVSPQETLFAISRKYQVPVGDIQNANEVLKQGLKIGQTIRVPYMDKSVLPAGTSVHKVATGETLFSISKKYGVTVDSLKQWNKLLGNDLSVGQSLIVKEIDPAQNTTVATVNNAAASVSQSVPQTVQKPTESKPTVEQVKVVEQKAETPRTNPEPVKTQPEVNRPASQTTQSMTPVAPGEWISHTVKSGETLFSLSTQYGSSVEDLIKWNALSSNNLRSGQVIKVGRAPEGPSTVPVIGTPRVVSSTAEMKVEPTPENTSGGFKNIKETGQAELIEGTGGHKKYLVLHRTAPVGSVIRVKNEENDLTIFARVVGTLPETGDNSKLIIKLSQAAYDQLKAVNPRFPVEILY
ncbi:LysM domain-containing protein [Algoriphagus aquaeductus]|uniref:LysM domain-containing protein n=1 Tax=Algoriphagus aquaeductus TaxID=475299 RepID=A0A326RRI9_9BACT|nr:LysM peptidoglycan-binding domain-containing protein [Algoriphagus aquaeductus]PZV84013.1 LysM domain-containing protein [Algoriphagus aquaeductus]